MVAPLFSSDYCANVPHADLADEFENVAEGEDDDKHDKKRPQHFRRLLVSILIVLSNAQTTDDNTIRYDTKITGKAFGLAISRSQVQILLKATLRNNLRQVVYTYVPLSPSSITWYRPKGGDALRLGR